MTKNFLATAVASILVIFVTAGFGEVRPSVVYGEDARKDILFVESSAIRSLSESTAAMIPTRYLIPTDYGMTTIYLSKFGSSKGLCTDEPFYSQPSAAVCSAFLVADDLMVTAGHCISNEECAADLNSFVFGFKMLGPTHPAEEVLNEDVFHCKEVVSRELSEAQDYALVRLDRPVRRFAPLKLQKKPLEVNDEIYVVGHPSGLPLKYADGAKVREVFPAFYRTNLDTFGGNSGSAVFNAKTNEVVGILVRGEKDYEYNEQRACVVSKHCGPDECRGEDVTNISYITKQLPKARRGK